MCSIIRDQIYKSSIIRSEIFSGSLKKLNNLFPELEFLSN